MCWKVEPSFIKTEPNRTLIKCSNIKNIEPTAGPLKWWEENHQTFPHLLPVVLKFLSIPSTSVCSERLHRRN